MNKFVRISKLMKRLSGILWARLRCLLHYLLSSFMSVLVRVNPFWIELGYSISLSLLGFLALKASEPRIVSSPVIPKDIDLFFTSTSVATVSGLSTIEMEFFSNSQLVFLTILMFVGGEAFTSMLGLGLVLMRAKIQHTRTADNPQKTDSDDHDIQLAVVAVHQPGDQESKKEDADAEDDLRLRCVKILGYLVLGYVVVIVLCI
ncbi:Cation transporter HKT2 [Sesamum alatum]|uniref:Cation transporter HKT2 n=1 Tax=Sesamum alatum TaxID=300844 RepID=A0AAE1XQD7_9LAMI|nr:Cation transporter HKT2 [Sesamum alatum]